MNIEIRIRLTLDYLGYSLESPVFLELKHKMDEGQIENIYLQKYMDKQKEFI